jgi:hypothetical protein
MGGRIMRSQSEYEFSKARLVMEEDEQDAMQDIFHDEVSTLFRGAREKWLEIMLADGEQVNFPKYLELKSMLSEISDKVSQAIGVI